MDEKELQEFSLEDIMKEFSDHDTVVETEQSEIEALEQLPEEPETEETPESLPEEEAPKTAVTSDTIRMSDTIRLNVVRHTKGEVHNAKPIEDEEEAPAEQQPEEKGETAEPFSEGWEPEYEQPIAEYVPPRPVLIHPRSRIRELKSKLVAGPEKIYYKLQEKGLGKLQVAIFFNILVVVISALATAMDAFGMVGENRMKLLVFGQFLAMLVSALLGSFRLIEGVEDIFKKRFSMNSALVVSFLLCCADGVICLQELRVPCCAAFSLQMLMSLWNTYQKRNTVMGQMDTLRKANHLEGIGVAPDYYEGINGLLRKEAELEDFMDTYREPSMLNKILSVYALVVTGLSIGLGITAGVMHGVSMGIQVAAVTTLAAVPASIFVTLSRPMAILERRLHSLHAVLCGWQGVEHLSKKAVFPLSHEDLCPLGTVKLNGVKFYGNRDSDEIIAYCAALCNLDGGALAPIFNHLLESRNGIRYEVANFNDYGTGGIGGEVNAEPVLLGTLEFLRSMGVDVPESIRVSHAVGISVDGELCGLFAIVYDKVRSSVSGLATLTSYRGLKPILISDDFMMTGPFLRSKFGVNPKRVLIPDEDLCGELREKMLPEDAKAMAISTGEGFAPFAYCVTGSKAVKAASTLGVIVHLIGGIVGVGIMAALAILGAQNLLTPANMFLYELVWMVPGLLITEWTRSI